MRSNYVIAAFRSFIKGDREHAFQMVRCLEAEERANGRTGVAHDLERLIGISEGHMIQLPNAPKEMSLTAPQRTLESVIVSDAIRVHVAGIVNEWHHRVALAEHDLPPRNILLLSGPSGNGKTSLAQAIATAVGLPFGLVAYNEVVDSHLGDTAKGVSKILEFAAVTPCLVFFDEADAIVTARTSSESSSASRECNLTVNQLLIKLDHLGTRSMAVFATNRDDVLDPAMRRRVHQTLCLEAPGERERRQMIALCNRRWPMIADQWEDGAAEEQSFAGIESRAMTTARRIVLERVAVSA